MTAIAVIENLGREDHGIVLDESMAEEIADLIGDRDAVSDVAEAVASIIRRRLHLSDQDVAASAGNANSWCDDVWLGLADYLSYREWCRVVGDSSGSEDANACVRNCGADAVEDAIAFLDALSQCVPAGADDEGVRK